MIASPYTKYKYLYPPRPTNKISQEQLIKYDNGSSYIGQVKYDGSCMLVFLDGNGWVKIMNRHNEEMTNPFLTDIDYKALHQGKGFMVLVGELLNKNKIGEDGLPFNKKFVVWDILVYNGMYLIGSTTVERLALLETCYPTARMVVNGSGIEMYNHLSCTDIKGVYKAPAYAGDFTRLYKELVQVQLFEGLVLKRADGKLAYGFTEKNNWEYILKCRKETKNYKF